MATTENVSVPLAVEELEWARQEAEQRDKSLSSVLTNPLHRRRKAEALSQLLEELGTDDITPEDLDRVRAEQR